MSVTRPPQDAPPDPKETSSYCGANSTDMRSSASTLSKTDISASAPNSVVGSHPGLLALARILGRSAAQADLRRARRGAVAIMGMADAVAVVAAMIAGALVWGVIMRLR